MKIRTLIPTILVCSLPYLHAAEPTKLAAPAAGDSATGTSDEAELAKQINNPVAALISLNFDKENNRKAA